MGLRYIMIIKIRFLPCRSHYVDTDITIQFIGIISVYNLNVLIYDITSVTTQDPASNRIMLGLRLVY